jgi:hypothetical protein
MGPRPAASATEEPDIPPKIILAKMETAPRPPRIQPTMEPAKSKSNCEVPLFSIMYPPNIKRGIATSKKESKDPYIMLGNMVRRLGLTIDTATTAAIPMEMEIGIPKITKETKIMANQALADKIVFSLIR